LSRSPYFLFFFLPRFFTDGFTFSLRLPPSRTNHRPDQLPGTLNMQLPPYHITPQFLGRRVFFFPIPSFPLGAALAVPCSCLFFNRVLVCFFSFLSDYCFALFPSSNAFLTQAVIRLWRQQGPAPLLISNPQGSASFCFLVSRFWLPTLGFILFFLPWVIVALPLF